ncbi:Dipeptide transport system permease protein DppC [Anaerohalosphaera lusitana]|uniref:Dipeptide transport system permease protein DppC n=1 Tax=Anaerohalosphaera lusitana TaxID=1936003 RepID=A0A1U9NNR2_9BACT|nr:ABC transporter permease [Anaerohalosphaera lusitana]AQT69374.1 Dipeptide transport system permease protein DppC [Anaerohalosphaera lusitana]
MSSQNNNKNTTKEKGQSLWADGWRRLKRRKFAMFCLGIIVIYFGLAGFVWFAEMFNLDISLIQYDETVAESYAEPGAEPLEGHSAISTIAGADFLGRSVLRATIYGAKVSLTVALFASVLSVLIGVPLGAIAGYFGGVVDEFIVWLYSTLSTIPYLILMMAFALVLKDKTVFGMKIAGSTTVYLAMGLTSWVGICRLIRGEIIKRKESEYVLAARALGARNHRIIFSHLIPNVFHIVIITFSIRFVAFIHAEVILSFLGLGDPDKPSWGNMISLAKDELSRGCWWQMTSATIAIAIISLALNIFGDALRDSLDPKLRT